MHLSTVPASPATRLDADRGPDGHFLVASVAIGVAQLFAWTMVATENARHETSSTALAVQKMEELRALAWTFAPEAAAERLSTNLSTIRRRRPAPDCPCLRPARSPRARPATSTISTDADDGWARVRGGRRAWFTSGGGASKRSRLDPDTLVFQSTSRPFGGIAKPPPREAVLQRRRGDALLTTLRTRKAAD